MTDTTVVINTQEAARSDRNERRAAARAMAIRCLQRMCFEENGTFTITPNGWSFGFPQRG